ncbi:MAG: GH92 family glycosyl hydrolase [Myxococcales bacterium]|nr:GH92 family glycosyl hydrolase [Myxococcota bacterium]MDW8282053.1 GH92 family glycosyl hydrolase [Myxococcales bacterium]
MVTSCRAPRSAVAWLVLLLAACTDEVLSPVEDPIAEVDPFIGTGGFGFQHGSSFVGAAAPHGLAKVGPDTRGPFGTVRFLHYSGYWYGDDIVQGFSHLHLHGTGAPDYGVLTLMPTDGFDATRTRPEGYESRLDKQSEAAHPGYYAVRLQRGDVWAEMTATPRAAHHRYWFAAGVPRHVIVDLSHHLEGGSVPDAELRLDPARGRIEGRLRTVGSMSGGFGGADVFFVVRTRQPPAGHHVWSGGAAPTTALSAAGGEVGCALHFPPEEGEPIELQVGLSLVSVAGAQANLEAELPDFDFAAARRRTEDAWRELLRAVRIEGGTRAERRIFYTALYHAFLMPTLQGDVDGTYRGHDGVVRRAEGFRFVSDMSLWDTYRTVHPLYALLAPTSARDAARSLVEMARQKGFFPKWPLAGGDSGTMVGASAEIVLADAHLRGVEGLDVGWAYGLLRQAALDPVAPPGGRGGRDQVEPYARLGYVPAGPGSVSITTEYGRDDDALARLAAALGQDEDARLLRERSLGYRKLFDPAVGFLRPRRADGAPSELRFDPLCFCPDYVEANAWQSLWMPSYDVAGLILLLGGVDGFIARLSEFFSRARQDWESSDPRSLAAGAAPRPYYWHGNQPSIHAGYLFAQAGRPDLTHKWVRWVMTTLYTDGPEGLAGNDDGGTLSAYYVLSALGLYPQAGSDEYIVGAPLFPRATVRVPGGFFHVVADGLAEGRHAVRAVELDGVPLGRPTLRHSELRAGRTLRFLMAEGP